MQSTYKFRLYPNEKQEEKLLWTLDNCRFVYNQMLAGLNGQEKRPNKYELKRQLPLLKESTLSLKASIHKFYRTRFTDFSVTLRRCLGLKRTERKLVD